MKDPETDVLVTALSALPSYLGWQFTYEYPGYFCYSHPNNDYSVFFTPDWEGDETLPIQVQLGDGSIYGEDVRLPLPHEGRTAAQIFEMVRPTLDKLLSAARAAACSVEVSVSLSPQEIVVLQMTHDHLVNDRGWLPHAAATKALAKVIAATETPT